MTLTELAAAHANLSRAYARAAGLEEHAALLARSAGKLEEVKANQAVLAKEIAIQEDALSSAKDVATLEPIAR